MSIVQALYRQSLIAQKNSLQYGLLQNSASQRSLLTSGYSPSFAGSISNSLELSAISSSIQLMAINAELSALQDAKINYLA
ncbi:hypothetical protein IJ531_00830 [bacterium]|nr:hypothetical protein [bacterium]